MLQEILFQQIRTDSFNNKHKVRYMDEKTKSRKLGREKHGLEMSGVSQNIDNMMKAALLLQMPSHPLW